jgi:hypothetical protein
MLPYYICCFAMRVESFSPISAGSPLLCEDATTAARQRPNFDTAAVPATYAAKFRLFQRRTILAIASGYRGR